MKMGSKLFHFSSYIACTHSHSHTPIHPKLFIDFSWFCCEVETSCLKPAKINSLARKKGQPQFMSIFIIRITKFISDLYLSSEDVVGLFFALFAGWWLLMRLSFDPVENRLRERVKLIRTFGYPLLPIPTLILYKPMFVCMEDAFVLMWWYFVAVAASFLSSQPFDKCICIIYNSGYILKSFKLNRKPKPVLLHN